MKNDKLNYEKLLRNLVHMPKKIMSLEGNEKTPEFVLHELCNEDHFNLGKAAFFVDSPDFNFLKGIAGFSKTEAPSMMDIWQDPHTFIDHMQKASFNQKVKSYSQASIKRQEAFEQELKKIARDLGIGHPAFHSWEMKHDNHGFLIYESTATSDMNTVQTHLENSLYLFSFCPIV